MIYMIWIKFLLKKKNNHFFYEIIFLEIPKDIFIKKIIYEKLVIFNKKLPHRGIEPLPSLI